MAVTKDSLRRRVVISRQSAKQVVIERSSKHTVAITKAIRKGVEM